MSFARNNPTISALQPEMAVGNYSAYDGTVEFYGRINALLQRDMRILDYGAGRAAWLQDEDSPFRRDIRVLRGKVREVIGCDIDPAVLTNRSVDRAFIVRPNSPLDLPDQSVDMVVADYVFEHIEHPQWFSKEINRILRVGGWICARTPTKYNYVSLLARLVANANHAKWLRQAQPNRKAEDVFPTMYRLNSRKDIANFFLPELFDDHSYLYCFEPQYHFGNARIYRALRFLHWLLPASLQGNLFVFIQKRSP